MVYTLEQAAGPVELFLRLAFFAAILAATYVAVRVLTSLLGRFTKGEPPALVLHMQRFVSWSIWTIGIVIALSELGLESTIFVALLGLAGIALIIGFRNVLADLVAREFLATYRPFKVGDWIQVGDHYGRVVEINAIDTNLITPDNELAIIPNSMLIRRVIVNRTKAGSLRLRIPVQISRTYDILKIEEELLRIGATIEKELATDRKPEVRVVEVEEDKVRLNLILWTMNPAKKDMIVSEVKKRIHNMLNELQPR